MSSADPGLSQRPNIHAQTILVVEDEIFVRCAIGDHLRTCGMHVIEAASAAEAIRVLASGTDIDLVLSDIKMPGSMDGLCLARWITHEHPAIKVILTTGFAEEDWDSAAGYAVLPKPYGHHELEDKIRMLLDRPGEAASSH
jgi:CheY-like chemotaxis protein